MANTTARIYWAEVEVPSPLLAHYASVVRNASVAIDKAIRTSYPEATHYLLEQANVNFDWLALLTSSHVWMTEIVVVMPDETERLALVGINFVAGTVDVVTELDARATTLAPPTDATHAFPRFDDPGTPSL